MNPRQEKEEKKRLKEALEELKGFKTKLTRILPKELRIEHEATVNKLSKENAYIATKLKKLSGYTKEELNAVSRAKYEQRERQSRPSWVSIRMSWREHIQA